MLERDLTITSNKSIADNVFRMDFSISEGIGHIQCGQFLNLSLGSPAHLLRRPFGIMDFDSKGKELSICYQVVGRGTEVMRNIKRGQTLAATLPLGNGFILGAEYEKVALIGGGAGVFPLRALPLCYPDKKYYSYLGFRSARNVCLNEEFASFSQTVITTDDGSCGAKCSAVDAFFDSCGAPDVILACGPTAMLRALKERLEAKNINIPAFVSLEERMGCGVGACYACSCRVKDASGTVHNARVCRDGPVFPIREVQLD